MKDALSREATAEFLAERADGLFRQYVEQLHLAQSTHFDSDWITVGRTFERFARAAVAAGVDLTKPPFVGAP